jgi:hypothetical protein
MKTIISVSFIFLLLSACGGSSENSKDRQLARVNKKILFASDLQGIGQGLSAADSSAQAAQYIDKWIEDQLLYDAAEKNIGETPRISRLVADYRASLILSEYEASLLAEQLDTFVSTEEIAAYYSKNKEQYQRGEDWVRCHFVRMPRTAAETEQVRNLFKDDSQKNKLNIGNLAQKSKATYQLDETHWVKLINVSSRLPEDADINRYLDGTTLDRTDESFLYLLKVFEFRDKTDATPLQEVQAEIKQVLIFLRKQSILRNLRQEIYKNAKEGGSFEVF